jgi:hypothetical protein
MYAVKLVVNGAISLMARLRRHARQTYYPIPWWQTIVMAKTS